MSLVPSSLPQSLPLIFPFPGSMLLYLWNPLGKYSAKSLTLVENVHIPEANLKWAQHVVIIVFSSKEHSDKPSFSFHKSGFILGLHPPHQQFIGVVVATASFCGFQ